MTQGKQFLMSINPTIFKKLEKISENNGVTVQELIRSVIIPDWIHKNS